MIKDLSFFFEKESQWKTSYHALRDICLASGLEETLKWGKPCYTLNGNNVVLMHGFKEYCALLFHKGALLNDPYDWLVQQTENVQAARQLRFESLEEIQEKASVISEYIQNAIEVEKAGLEVQMKKTSEYQVPEELTEAWKADAGFERAFNALTPGRQRGYLLYFSQAKQSNTRKNRIEKYRDQIMEGKGLND